jgi:hypothetical protein
VPHRQPPDRTPAHPLEQNTPEKQENFSSMSSIATITSRDNATAAQRHQLPKERPAPGKAKIAK